MTPNVDWKPVVRFALRGARFDGSLTIGDLPELEAFQHLISEIAAAIWRRDHPQRVRLPKGFEVATQLRFATIEKGSSVVPLEAQAVFPPQAPLFDAEGGQAFGAVTAAVDLTWRGIASAHRGERLPHDLPRDAIPRLAALGGTHAADERLEVTPIDGVERVTKPPAILDAATRTAIEREVPGRYEDAIVVEGRVTAADVTYRRFRVHTHNGRELAADFSAEQESIVTTALRDHDAIGLSIEGRALYNSEGNALRVTRVDVLRTLTGEDSVTPLGGVWASLAAFGRNDAVSGLPQDLASNIDRYLYETDD
jgi:hypothetical protein